MNSKKNIVWAGMLAGEVDGATRTQKFLRYGATGCSGTGSAEVGKYVQ